MKKNLYSIYDVKVQSFMDPVMYRSKGEAIRAFTDAVNDDKTFLSKHPSDYVLYEIGTFDGETGKIQVPVDVKACVVVSALDVKVDKGE